MLLSSTYKVHKTKYLTRVVFLLALTLAVESIGLPQFFTGPFINFMLILSSLLVDTFAGVLIGCFTPFMALLRGQLPAFLWPLVPFIIVANASFVVIFKLWIRPFQKQNLAAHWRTWVGLTMAATIKFIWLYTAVTKILPLLLAKQIPSALVTMMALPQFITAMVGGMLSIFFFKLLKSRKIFQIRG